MKNMRKRLRVAAIVFLVAGTWPELAANSPSTKPVVRPRVAVEFENEGVTLAKGFADAFKKVPPGGKYIKVSTPSGTEFLEGSVDVVEAIEGVLFIRTEKGIVHIVSARNIVTITNEKPSD